MTKPSHPGVSPEVDRWTRWFNRLSQIAGLCVVGYEVVLRKGGAEFDVLLFAGAMMLGPAGLRLILRGVSALAEQGERSEDERK